MSRFHHEEHHSGRAAHCREAIGSGAGELLAAFRHCGSHHGDIERAGHRHVAAGHLPELCIDMHVPCVQRAFQVRGNHCPVARSLGGFGIVFSASVNIEIERERTGCLPPIRCVGRVSDAPPAVYPLVPAPYQPDGSDRVPVAPPVVVPAQPDLYSYDGSKPIAGDGNAPRPGDAPSPVAQQQDVIKNENGSEVTLSGGHITRIKDRAGRVIEFGKFDSAGNPTEFTLPNEQTGQPQTWVKANDGKWHRLEYDARRREFFIGPRTWEGSISADQQGNFTMVSADGHHRITRQGDGSAVHAQIGADGKERVMRVVQGNGASQDFLYDREGCLNGIRKRDARGIQSEILIKERDGHWHSSDSQGRETGRFKAVTVDAQGHVVKQPEDAPARAGDQPPKKEGEKSEKGAKSELDKIAQHLSRAEDLGKAKDLAGAWREFSLAMSEADNCVPACLTRLREIKALWDKENDPVKLKKLEKDREVTESLLAAHFDVRVTLARFLDRNNQPEAALAVLDSALRIGVDPGNKCRTPLDGLTPDQVARVTATQEWQDRIRPLGGETPFLNPKEYLAQRYRKELRDRIAGK